MACCSPLLLLHWPTFMRNENEIKWKTKINGMVRWMDWFSFRMGVTSPHEILARHVSLSVNCWIPGLHGHHEWDGYFYLNIGIGFGNFETWDSQFFYCPASNCIAPATFSTRANLLIEIGLTDDNNRTNTDLVSNIQHFIHFDSDSMPDIDVEIFEKCIGIKQQTIHICTYMCTNQERFGKFFEKNISEKSMSFEKKIIQKIQNSLKQVR